MHKSRRKNLPILMLTVVWNIFNWIKSSPDIIALCVFASVMLIWIFKPEFLNPLAYIFNKIVFALSFAVTAVLVAILYYFVFVLFKPILYLNDKRFFKKPNKKASTYYTSSSNEWKKNIEELY